VDHGRDKQRRVGDPAGHDHVGPELQGLDDGAGAEVGHAEGDALADGGDAGAGVHVAEVRAAVAQLVDAGGDVVAGDRGHPQAVHAQVGGHPARGCGRTVRVHAAGVGDDADALVARQRQKRAQEVGQVAGESAAGVAQAVPLEDRHRQLRESVAADVGHLAPLRDGDGAVGRVAVEALPGTDAHRPHVLITRPTYTNPVSALGVRIARGAVRRRRRVQADRSRS
jgi:hypothetical protein